MGVWGRVFDEWELMPVMVRVEKIKNLRNKACLPSLLLSDVSRVLGWWFPYFFALGKAKKNKEKKRKKNKEITTKVPKTHQISKKREGRQALFCKFLNFSALAITGINSHSNSCKIKDSPPSPHRLGRLWLQGSGFSIFREILLRLWSEICPTFACR